MPTIADKRLYFICFFFLFLLSAFLISHLAGPFSNKCIRGDCKNGEGIYIFTSGMKYAGEWKNGKRDGQGTLTYYDGSRYTGGWKNNRMHGRGIKIYTAAPPFKQYDGAWENGNKHGKGTLIYLDGGQYSGEWKNGAINGQGLFTAIDGRTLKGEWKDGILHGQVVENFPDGRILEVPWIDGKRHGTGIITYPDGTKTAGEWINDKLAGSLDFYLFRNFEFQDNYTIAALSGAIKKDIHVSIEAEEHKVTWLNKLLRIPDLYEKLNKKILDKKLSADIEALLDSTKDSRNKKFSELNSNKQKDIIKLNRLLIEYLYPGQTPKS